jgi:hypothetical protein
MPKKSKTSKKKTLAQLFKIPTFRKPDPCCVDVLKTGQAYSVPLGFKDYKGTERIDNKTSNLPTKQVVNSPFAIAPTVASPKPKTPSLIFVQPTDMGVPTTLGPNKDITIMRPGPVKTGVKKIIRIPKPSVPLTTQKINTDASTQVDKPKTPSVIFVQPTDMGVPTTLGPNKDITIREPEQFSFAPPNYEEVETSIRRTIRVPRRNSREELENRYEAITGSRYSGPKLTYVEFRELVNFISNKKNV